jgi:hypothetical protein
VAVVIAKRGNRWRVVVQAGRDPLTGRRRQLSGSAASKTEALRVERALMAQAAERVTPRIALRQVVAEWWQSGPRLAPSTRANYRMNLDRHILPLIGSRQVSEIRPRLVVSFLVHLREKGLAPGTVRKVRTVLSAVMSYAVAMEYVESTRS